jgi:hypothetical protein
MEGLQVGEALDPAVAQHRAGAGGEHPRDQRRQLKQCGALQHSQDSETVSSAASPATRIGPLRKYVNRSEFWTTTPHAAPSRLATSAELRRSGAVEEVFSYLNRGGQALVSEDGRATILPQELSRLSVVAIRRHTPPRMSMLVAATEPPGHGADSPQTRH